MLPEEEEQRRWKRERETKGRGKGIVEGGEKGKGLDDRKSK